MDSPIKGYRNLSDWEISLINDIKTHAETLHTLVGCITTHLTIQKQTAATPEEETRIDEAEPMEWVKEAKRHLQLGMMELTRAVAQPTTF